MVQFFYSVGDGLQSHPRLICDTLFTDNTSWMNMPCCVSILRDVFNIEISLSGAYNYTENYRAKPVKQDNIMQELVHCDVEVVQRPSKSWQKVSYSDHDWNKDTQRSLQITTDQFVKLKEFSSPEETLVGLGGLPIYQSRLQGGGLSVVKIHFTEHSTIFRHLNELLYLVSLTQFKPFFLDTDSNRLVPNFLLTVDGGTDERPRNKGTQIAVTLLRRLLNLQKVKTISYAEDSSKRHSVERYHFAEGRLL